MSFLSRLFGTKASKRDAMRPLWFRVVEMSRLPEYYAKCGVADTIDGRFDMVVNILSMTLLRMEKTRTLKARAAYLTELFVEDMDGQLRESAVGQDHVGKHMGKLMAVLGGRIGAIREALDDSDAALAEVLERNVTFGENADPTGLALRLRTLAEQLAATSDSDLLEGKVG